MPRKRRQTEKGSRAASSFRTFQPQEEFGQTDAAGSASNGRYTNNANGGSPHAQPSLFDKVVGNADGRAFSSPTANTTEAAPGPTTGGNAQSKSDSLWRKGQASSFSLRFLSTTEDSNSGKSVPDVVNFESAGRAFSAISDFDVVSETRMSSERHQDVPTQQRIRFEDDWSLKSKAFFSSPYPLTALSWTQEYYRPAQQDEEAAQQEALRSILRYYQFPSDESIFTMRLITQQSATTSLRKEDKERFQELVEDRVSSWSKSLPRLLHVALARGHDSPRGIDRVSVQLVHNVCAVCVRACLT